jgi:hypothetical protein
MYHVVLTVDGKDYSQPLKVEADPVIAATTLAAEKEEDEDEPGDDDDDMPKKPAEKYREDD